MWAPDEGQMTMGLATGREERRGEDATKKAEQRGRAKTNGGSMVEDGVE